MSKLRVGLIQLNSTEDKERNLNVIAEQINSAVKDKAELVVLPEYASYLADYGEVEQAETLEGKTISLYRKLARENEIYLHCGSFIEKGEDDRNRSYNTSVLINPTGEIMEVYRKIHLFDVEIEGKVRSKESDTIIPGDKTVTTNTETACLGFSICYDLRFPELYRKLVDKGAEIIFAPAAFTLHTGKDHWEVLLRARAIENQVYILAPAQTGVHPTNKPCYGNSMVVDPWGVVIARASEGVGHITADIDLDYLQKLRRNIPCLSHRRV